MINKHIFRFAIIASFFTSLSSAYAQSNTFWLNGHVRDNFTDAEIKEAKVYLLSKDSMILDSTQTTSGNLNSGFFRLE